MSVTCLQFYELGLSVSVACMRFFKMPLSVSVACLHFFQMALSVSATCLRYEIIRVCSVSALKKVQLSVYAPVTCLVCVCAFKNT